MKYILFGQGNPGKNYYIRHNLGFHFLDGLSNYYNSKFLYGSNYYISTVHHNENIFLLVKPQCGYNVTGKVVLDLFEKYKLDNTNLVVIHDDVDLSLGRIKVKKGGGSGGCNGIKSIDSEIGTNDYSRIRVGIGRPSTGKVTGDFVCGEFTKEEHEILNNDIFPNVYEKMNNLDNFEIENLRKIL